MSSPRSPLGWRSWLPALLAASSLCSAAPLEKLAPGDVLSLAFSIKHDHIDGGYQVNKDGTLHLPFIGRLYVAGKSPEETKQVIEQEFLKQQIYSRLTVQITREVGRIKTESSGQHLLVPKKAASPGDHLTPEEKYRIFEQLEVQKTQ